MKKYIFDLDKFIISSREIKTETELVEWMAAITLMAGDNIFMKCGHEYTLPFLCAISLYFTSVLEFPNMDPAERACYIARSVVEQAKEAQSLLTPIPNKKETH